jgi:hypothetical protein
VKIQFALIVGMDAVWTQLNPCNKRVKILALLRNKLLLDDDSVGLITRSMNDAQKTSGNLGNLGKLVLIVLNLPNHPHINEGGLG